MSYWYRSKMRWLIVGGLLLASCTSATVSTTAAPPTTSHQNITVIPAGAAAPRGVDPTSSCMRRAMFADPATSEFLLPYPVGDAYELHQSYCFAEGTHNDELSYDFAMPIGSDIVASRAGTVVDLYDGSPDDGTGQANFLIIEHLDGTAALYGHLQQHGILVGVGDEVAAGERVAKSGFSGVAGFPHLHFTVFAGWPDMVGGDIAVNFRNAEGPLDFLGGLLTGARYEALPAAQPIAGQTPQRPGVYRDATLANLDLAGSTLWNFDFAGADLTGAMLTGTNLEWASLEDTTLEGADLSHADLSHARLKRADLTGADLRGADLSVADLTEAVLAGADLSGAVLGATDLTGADLSDAILEGATLVGVVWDASTRWPQGYEPPAQP